MDRTLTVSGQAGISSNVYGYRFFATEYTPSATNELVTKNYLDTVSYTHLTLPTKRIV